MELPELKFDRRRKQAEHCPCGKSNRDGKFAPYEGYEEKGYCHSCGETFLPELPTNESCLLRPFTPKKKQIDTIPIEVLYQSLSAGEKLYKVNHFIQGLKNQFKFQDDQINTIIDEYKIGNSKQWKGAVTFPCIDIDGRLRQIKAMGYNPLTCKRIKEPFNQIIALGKRILKNENANLSSCFFGEHLLKKYPDKKVGIVESEKTAIIASVYLPNFVWLAKGGKNGCKWTEKNIAKALSNRKAIVYLFPDLTKSTETVNAFELWSRERNVVQLHVGSTVIEVNNILETKATEEEKAMGMDLADYLTSIQPPRIKKASEATLFRDGETWTVQLNEHGYPAMWDN